MRDVSKRMLDLCLVVPGLVIAAPPLLLAALLILLDDRGPVFFRQWRVGRGGRPFRMWKLRTMVVDAERRGAPLTVGRDPRITRIGHWLRQSKLDELPQLFNVLAGEMAFVGPRPEVEHYVAHYTSEQRRVLELLPGITDPASIRFRHESELLAASADPERTYLDEVMPEKIRLNLDYAARATWATDLGVIGRTLVRLLR